MKKVESVLDGSLGWGKTRTLATFPQILFCLLSLILPKIFIIQRGEGGASASHPRVEALFKRLVHLNLTLPFFGLGEMFGEIVSIEGDMFLFGKEAEEKKIDKFFPFFEGLSDFDWLLKNSNFFKNLMLSQASKVYFDNEEFIKMEIKRLRGIKEKPNPEPEGE